MTHGETDLPAMLRTLEVHQKPGRFAFVSVEGDPSSLAPRAWIDGAHAAIREDEGWTIVAETTFATSQGLPYEFEAAWLTVQVHSALEAVGLTAAISTALGDAGIPCNMLAGKFHDHLLVPYEDVDAARSCLEQVRDQANRNEL